MSVSSLSIVFNKFTGGPTCIRVRARVFCSLLAPFRDHTLKPFRLLSSCKSDLVCICFKFRFILLFAFHCNLSLVLRALAHNIDANLALRLSASSDRHQTTVVCERASFSVLSHSRNDHHRLLSNRSTLTHILQHPRVFDHMSHNAVKKIYKLGVSCLVRCLLLTLSVGQFLMFVFFSSLFTNSPKTSYYKAFIICYS